jgi:hypothetical protein
METKGYKDQSITYSLLFYTYMENKEKGEMR